MSLKGALSKHTHTFVMFNLTRGAESDLQVIAGLLAVGDPLDLGGGGEVKGLSQVREAKRSGDAHICQRQVVYVQQRPQTR